MHASSPKGLPVSSYLDNLTGHRSGRFSCRRHLTLQAAIRRGAPLTAQDAKRLPQLLALKVPCPAILPDGRVVSQLVKTPTGTGGPWDIPIRRHGRAKVAPWQPYARSVSAPQSRLTEDKLASNSCWHFIPDDAIVAQTGGHLLHPDLHLGGTGSDVIVRDVPCIAGVRVDFAAVLCTE